MHGRWTEEVSSTQMAEGHLISTCPPAAAMFTAAIRLTHTAITADKVIPSSLGPPAKAKINNPRMPPGAQPAGQTADVVSFPSLHFHIRLSLEASDAREEKQRIKTCSGSTLISRRI